MVGEGAREKQNKYIHWPDDYFSLMPYWTKLEILASLDCIVLPIVLAFV